MTTIVIDSGVVIKWFLPEDDSTTAETIQSQLERGDVILLAPELLLAEVANILWKKRSQLGEEEATRIIDSVISTGIWIVGMEPLIREAYRIARQFDRTAYDSTYIALARERDCDFVTADERLFNAVSSREPRVKLLRDYGAS
ncbi:MAG: type II toxin-antitoxin system VapC family toxin [Chloroflexota bacterium]